MSIRKVCCVFAAVIGVGLLAIYFIWMPSPRKTEITGRYQLTTNLAPSSLNTVSIEQVINLSCIHCYRVSKQIQAIAGEFGSRVEIQTIVVHGKGENDFATQLYYIAERNGKGETALKALFSRKFEKHEDIQNAAVIENVAAEISMLDAYKANYGSANIVSLMTADLARARRYGITATPAWIIERQLEVEPDIDNLRTVISSLLKKRGEV